jgi:hypothetical protein
MLVILHMEITKNMDGRTSRLAKAISSQIDPNNNRVDLSKFTRITS